ncbi:MAG: glycosyltransferase [Leptolyngbyaceae cyanobacterium bins.302]|nr:glycosyltransferase [Leptolyngbyaceae cyanobacterium bins.302]
MLSWSLIVCTLDRPEVLEKCIAATLAQTRSARQIIIVDASHTWERNKKFILESFASTAPEIEWIYVSSDQKSLTYQRNIGLQYATSDVAFLLDDDSFMYPDCAEHVMRVYEADVAQRIGGVTTLLVEAPPDLLATNEVVESTSTSLSEPMKRPSLMQWLKQKAEGLWYIEQLFIPYDGHYHTYDTGSFNSRFPIFNEVLFHGCRMTFRTAAVLEVGGFNEALIRAAIAEDSDISYRVSRKYALVLTEQAKLFHAHTPIARMKRFPNAVLRFLNITALFILNSTCKTPTSVLIYRYFLTRVLLEFIRDCTKPQHGFPNFRGGLYAMPIAIKMLGMTQQELRSWYPIFQAEFLDRHKKQSSRVERVKQAGDSVTSADSTH